MLTDQIKKIPFMSKRVEKVILIQNKFRMVHDDLRFLLRFCGIHTNINFMFRVALIKKIKFGLLPLTGKLKKIPKEYLDTILNKMCL